MYNIRITESRGDEILLFQKDRLAARYDFGDHILILNIGSKVLFLTTAVRGKV